MIRNLKTLIIWHDAKECLPAKDGKYWVIINTDIENKAHVMDVPYSHGKFNATKDNDSNAFDVLYWTEMPSIKAIDMDYEEDW